MKQSNARQTMREHYSNAKQNVKERHSDGRKNMEETGCNSGRTESMYSSDTGRAESAYTFDNKRIVRIYISLLNFVFIRPTPLPSPTHSGRSRKRYSLIENEAEERAEIDEDSRLAVSSEWAARYVETVVDSERHFWRAYNGDFSHTRLACQRDCCPAYLSCFANQD